MSAHSSSLPKAITRPKPTGRGPPQHRQSVSIENHTLGRSFIFSSFKPELESPLNSFTATVHSSSSINETTVGLAGVGVPEIDDDNSQELSISDQDLERYPRGDFFAGASVGASSGLSPLRDDPSHIDRYLDPDTQPLLEGDQLKAYYQATNDYQLPGDADRYTSNYVSDVEAQCLGSGDTTNVGLQGPYSKLETPSGIRNLQKNASETIKNAVHSVKNADLDTIINECVIKPVGYLPAVFLGCLLNILDGLSYGMIMFPIGETVFSGMGPQGLSMFYVSTIISQLVYSLGGSAFKSGIGSEMIEVTPFFHQMAINIMLKLGKENQDAILATTMVTFALSSIVTGLVFFILGKCRLGKLVGFFPRHILVGCIGGVGYFLVVTGIEVSSRLEGGLEYNLPTLKYLLEPLVFCQWVVPLALAAILVAIQHYNSSSLIVPLYFIAVFVLFHLVVMFNPSWSLQAARDYGWVFEAHESNIPWYSFYQFYKFGIVNWWAVLNEVPTMLALTFFGILHVPINVPALAVTVNMDEFDVDRELVAHGVSNALSGLCGSIQNYLVYTNSVLFIKAGADSRLSGVMLAVATGIIMWIGPVIIGFIPVAVVGALIYLLGYELLKEALYDTKGKLRKFEYLTIVIIVVTMGAWDFVYGILVGVMLACVSFVVEAARKPIVSGIYTGEYARSIVVRHPKQQEFLKDVGKQIYIMKLQGSLFFGSIGGLEEKVRERFDSQVFAKEPIKYLILDMNKVLSIDFSAAEGFRRIRNLIVEKDSYFIISSVEENSSIVQALKESGLWETKEHHDRIQLFNNLNSGLEWCENRFLEDYRELARSKLIGNTGSALSEQRRKLNISLFDDPSGSRGVGAAGGGSTSPIFGSPRHVHLLKAAKKSLESEQEHNQVNKFSRRQFSMSSSGLKQPLSLILTVMQGVSEIKNEQFWGRLSPYLTKQFLPANQLLYEKQINQPCIYFVESGLIGCDMCFNDVKFFLNSSVLPLTLFGDLVSTDSHRLVRYFSITESIVWKLDSPNMEQLKKQDRDLYEELLVVTLRLFTNKFDSITSNILVSS